MHEPKVAIIVLNWNGEHDTIECLESLLQITYSNYEIIVVDNGSECQSIATIKGYAEGKINVKSPFFCYTAINKPMQIAEFTLRELHAASEVNTTDYDLPSTRKLTLILNERNLGFAEGNNVGIRYAIEYLRPTYTLLLNNDTVVHPDFLSLLVETAQSEEMVGAVGPAIYPYDDPSGLQELGGKINMWTGKRTRIIRNSKRSHIETHVDFVSGASILFNAEIVGKVGLLDPDYFMYVEDIDWCYRIKKKGYSILVNPNSSVWHKGSMSTGGGYRASVLSFYVVRSGILFMKKNAEFYHMPTFIAFSLYYFAKRFLKNLVTDPEKAKLMMRGIKASFSKKV